VVREDQCIRNDNVLPSSGSEDNDLGDILAGQRLNALVDSIGFGLVTVEADDREFLCVC
jgi:hypothetical protein